jgi:hypothetical protein
MYAMASIGFACFSDRVDRDRGGAACKRVRERFGAAVIEGDADGESLRVQTGACKQGQAHFRSKMRLSLFTQRRAQGFLARRCRGRLSREA